MVVKNTSAQIARFSLAALLSVGFPVGLVNAQAQNGRPQPLPPQSQAQNQAQNQTQNSAPSASDQSAPTNQSDAEQSPAPATRSQFPPGSGAERAASVAHPPRIRQPEGGKVTLTFSDASVEELMPWIAEQTGKVVLPINPVTLRNKKITLLNDQPVDATEALDMVITALRLNSVGVIETERFIILDDLQALARNRQVPVLSPEDDVMSRVDRGNLVVKIYRLKHAPADSVGERLQDHLPDYATLTIDSNSNQILLYGDVGLAQHMQQLINHLDRNHVVIESMTFRLAYADAQLVADQIYDLFEDTGTMQQGVPGRPQQPRGRQTQRQPGGAPTTPGVTSPGPPIPLRLAVNTQGNSITVYTDPERLELIAKHIREDWDLPRPKDTQRVYRLEHTDPIKVTDLLHNLLGGGSGTTGARGRATAPRGTQATPGSVTGSGISDMLGDIYRIEAYPDQNSVVVLSRTVDSLDYLDSIIEAIDQPSTVGMPMVIELKHANAVALAEELNILLSQAGAGDGMIRPASGLSGQFETGGTGSLGTSGASNIGGDRVSGGAASGDRIRFPWQVNQPPDDQSPESPLIGKVRIMPVVRQNALAVLGPVAHRHAVAEIIRELDRPGRQVMISAIIVEIELNDDLALGLRFGSGDLVPSSNDNTIAGSLGFEGARDNLFGSLFDTSVLDVGVNINVLLEALRQKTNIRILQEPRVFTADNQEAIFFDGQRIPFISNSSVTDIGGLTQSFEYQDVGVMLNVRPRITAQHDVDMEINLVLSNVVPGQTLFGGAIIDRRQTTTQVIIQNGQTIMLSGMFRDSETQTTRGIPLLEDIPLIGELFRSRQNSKVTSELVAFITPIVVDNPSDNDVNFNALERAKLHELAKPLKEQIKDRRQREPRGVPSYHQGIGSTSIEASVAPDNDDDRDTRDTERRQRYEQPMNEQRRQPATAPPVDVDELEGTFNQRR